MAAITIAAVSIVLAIEATIFNLPADRWWWGILFSLIIGAVNVHYTQVGRSNERLRLAQSEIEHLAKVAERERIARDLHDLLGHTLSVIILKSELASKMAERDVERARSEIRDVERISRQALAQVRAAVRGFRSGGLQAELEEARRTFAAAGVTLAATFEPVTVPPATEAVLVLAIREAVTNVVRHARATRCSIDIRAMNEKCTVTIADDGRGGSASFGSGLSGMRERVEAVGGTLVVEGKRGMTVTIAIPLPATETHMPAEISA
jgi:two-component system sensor histidine kinase DesK